MLRSAAARSGLAATRFMATDAKPPATQPSSHPPPPPSSASAFIRRAMPFAILGGTGYVLYKGATDPDFRAAVEDLVPGSARIFDLLPAPLPPPNFVAHTNKKEPTAQIESKQKDTTTLPSNYNSVSDILLSIEESKVANAAASPEPKKRQSHNSHLPKHDIALDIIAPTHRHQVEANNSAARMQEPGDGPRIAPKSVKPVSSDKPKQLKVPRAEQDIAKPPIVEVDDVTAANQKDLTLPEKPGAKEKLARILGKGDFQAEKVQGPDVVDHSEYQKPNFAVKPGIKTHTKKVNESRLCPSAQKSKLEPPAAGNARASPTLEEVKALRAELQSQTKWEAVRLQEAVRSQMVEDKKAAAKEMAAITQKHAEELVRVREDALSKANKLVSERTREVKESADKQRDAEVGKLLKAKEEELRLSIALEFANKQHEQVVKRDQAIADVKSQVAAMTSQFDGLLMHAERAKEAAKRASHAFLLRETIGSSRPLGSQLSKASDESELGRLVKESVPDCAIQKGVCSVDALQMDFSRAAKRGLSVAMVPEGKAGTIWGHFLGTIFSRLKIPVDTRMESDTPPKCNEERIRLAQQLVKEGDIGGAVSTLESLDGLTADVMADWIGEARARLAADLAADVLLADAIIAQVAFTRGNKTEAVVA